MNNPDDFDIHDNMGDVIGIGIHGNNNIIAKNMHIDSLIVNLRPFGLELLRPDHFEHHKKVEENIKSWYRGFTLSLESIYYNKELKRIDVFDSIISKLNDQRCLLLLGESGSSKTTILNEVICYYFKQGYVIFYNYGDKEVNYPESIRDIIENAVTKGNKVLIAIDNIHDKKVAAIFYVIELLKSFDKSDNVIFILTGRLPDYDWFVKYGQSILQERLYKDAIKSFEDNPLFRYQLSYFSIEDIRNFAMKYSPSNALSSKQQQLQQAIAIHSKTNGNPLLVKFAILGSSLRKDVEDRIEDYLKEDFNFMLTAVVTSILSIGGIKITDQLLEKFNLKKFAIRLDHAILFNSGNGEWTTIHNRWDMELLKILFVSECDEMVLDINKGILEKAISCMIEIDDEHLIVSIIQALYNTIAINNLIPLDMIDIFVRESIPKTLSNESMSIIYGVIMPPVFIMMEKYDTVEKLCDRAAYTQPVNSEICYNLALTLFAIGKYDKAIGWCDRSIKLLDSYGDVWYLRLCINMMNGNIEVGLENLKKAIKIKKETYAELAKRETYFEPVRHDQRFISIVEEKL